MTPEQEKRARQLSESAGLSVAFDIAMTTEGPELLRVLLAQLDEARELIANWRSHPHPGGAAVWDIMNSCANDLAEVIGENL